MTRHCFICRILLDYEGPCIEHDNIAKLCHLVKQCGGTMRLYGRTISGPEELRAKALEHAVGRLSGQRAAKP